MEGLGGVARPSGCGCGSWAILGTQLLPPFGTSDFLVTFGATSRDRLRSTFCSRAHFVRAGVGSSVVRPGLF